MLLCLLLNGLRVALALLVQLVALDPQELEETDLPRLSELTFLVLLVAVLLQSATQQADQSTGAQIWSQNKLRGSETELFNSIFIIKMLYFFFLEFFKTKRLDP